MTDWLWLAVPLWFVLSIVSFIQMVMDKRRAVRGSRRIPERRLLFYAAIGGAAGGWAGMRLFRHKTKHAAFAYGLPLLALLHAALLVILFGYGNEG